MEATTTLKPKDFSSDQDVKWCPGCGDYSILKQVQTILPKIGATKENTVFIAGIGCSSRFPYYMDTYGMHSIHGRAPAVATGLKVANPKLNTWIITGDGDSLSIGGNHTIHLLRRNVDVNVLLFNNEIYGLTKGQYSPTSRPCTVTKSSPHGSLDAAFNPLALAMGADASFIARTMDRDPKHMQEVLLAGAEHVGTSFIEIYQNCLIFNDGAFFIYTDKDTKAQEALILKEGEPLIYGADGQKKGIIIDGLTPKIVELGEDLHHDQLWIHDSSDRYKAQTLVRLFDDPNTVENNFPRPFGVFYKHNRPTYDQQLHEQLAEVIEKEPNADIDALIAGNVTWDIA